jgi:polyribonucleotide 5'-hydroxyl-kinase
MAVIRLCLNWLRLLEGSAEIFGAELSLGSRVSLQCAAAAAAAVIVQLLEGSAEIFGAELSLGSKVSLRGNALAVFTWHGCKLAIEGEPDFV